MELIKERGAASININLSEGVITVTHAEDGSTLAKWLANEGDWAVLWSTINALKAVA